MHAGVDWDPLFRRDERIVVHFLVFQRSNSKI
jgi:hypothetical protein